MAGRRVSIGTRLRIRRALKRYYLRRRGKPKITGRKVEE